MNDLIPIKVQSQSGRESGEYPVSFHAGQYKFVVSEIIDRWYQGDSDPEFPPANYFKVNTKQGKTFLLKHEMISGNWFLLIKGESVTFQTGYFYS